MRRKKRFMDTLRVILFTIIPLFIINCATMTDLIRPGTSDTFPLQKQIKLTFKPDSGTYFTDKEISDLFEKAKSVGLELDYKIRLIDQESGKLSFITKGLLRKYPIKADVLVNVMANRELAYVYITIFGDSQDTIDSAMVEFKNKYKSKFQ